jgi:hypothetical protein
VVLVTTIRVDLHLIDHIARRVVELDHRAGRSMISVHSDPTGQIRHG